MTPADAARDLLERRNAQGLPPKVSDPAVLRRLAALFGPAVPEVVRDVGSRKVS
jgi:hypothetical protein